MVVCHNQSRDSLVRLFIQNKYYESSGRNDSFSKNHTFPYSAIGLQELNLAYHYPIIYWNTACLIVNAGADDSIEQNKATQYGKIASAIASMQKAGVQVALPLINEAKFSFVADEKNNRILFGLKGLCGIGDDIAKAVVENQPYKSLFDFCERMVDTKIVPLSKMLILIKAGCFTELDSKNRKETMYTFLKRCLFKPIKQLTLSQLPKMEQMNLIPEELKIVVRYCRFKSYVLQDVFLHRVFIDKEKKLPKKGYHDRYFQLNSISQPFFQEHFSENAIVEVSGENYIISEKRFLKEADEKILPIKNWLSNQATLDLYHKELMWELWNTYAAGSISHWEMQSLSFYHGVHELDQVDKARYGIVNYFSLPETPQIYSGYTRCIQGKKKLMPKYRIARIAGTVLDSDNTRRSITLLTKYGVVTVKFQKGQYSFYHKRISANGKVTEDSWFKRGTLLIVCGYRQEQIFRCCRYADTVYTHTAAKIERVCEDGTLLLTAERGEDCQRITS